MTLTRAPWTAYIDRQHRRPSGPVGQLIGERMLRQHTPETNWSVELLDIQPGDRVLEIGFGAGRGLALALQRATHGWVTGVDLSPTMIAAAARRNRAAIEQGRLALLRGDIAALPFEHSSFDKLFSIHTFYFWPDQHAVCLGLAELLAPGGRLVSTFATARRRPDGAWDYWPVQQTAEALVEQLDRHPQIAARLARGPDSREFNNVAIIVDTL
jgi:SAM-dependent methyltransferase